MLYSIYYRIYDPALVKRAGPGEVTDIEIMSPVPYVDAVITEKFQAGILRKIKHKVKGMNDLEIFTLKDIRWEDSTS